MLKKFTFLYCCIFFVSAEAQVISLNSVALTVVGGSPSSCSAGGYKLLNTAAVSGNCVTVTNNSFQNGAIWACSTINLNQSFKLNFQANFGNNPTTGDGIAFILQTEGMPQVIGGRAGGIGYAQGDGSNCLSGTCPITPSVDIEFDTFDNTSSGLNDIACNHISVQSNGIMTSGNTLVSPICMITGGTSVLDGANHDVCITWDPATPNLSVFFDGIQKVNYNSNIRTAFSNPASVYWGFTGASGGFSQTQKICSIQLQTNIASPSCSVVLPVELIYFRGYLEDEKKSLNLA